MKSFFYSAFFSLILLCACASGPRARTLSQTEMDRYQLNGNLHDARICPNEFTISKQNLRVNGPCEIIDCVQLNQKISCTAVKAPL